MLLFTSPTTLFTPSDALTGNLDLQSGAKFLLNECVSILFRIADNGVTLFTLLVASITTPLITPKIIAIATKILPTFKPIALLQSSLAIFVIIFTKDGISVIPNIKPIIIQILLITPYIAR